MNLAQKDYRLVTLLLVASGLWRWEDLGNILEYSSGTYQSSASHTKQYLPWKPGILDLHHLHVGSAVSTFVITPDGTTILIDAGEINVQRQREWFQELGPPYNKLQALDPFPNATKTPSEWILDYLNQFWPHNNSKSNKTLDYGLVTHFHGDHMGAQFGDDNRVSKIGNYSLSGIPHIANHLIIHKLIDRDYPNYNFPRDLSKVGDFDIDNYLQFVNTTAIPQIEHFQVGSTTQIQQVHQPAQFDFSIQVVKNNDRVWLPNGTVSKIPGIVMDEQGKWDENAMSGAIVMEYGDFRYYEGGDQEVVRNSKGEIILDTVGPVAQIVGKVDVASLNHHGHGVTSEFTTHMDPDVLILQGWCSDQPPKKSVELLNDRIGQEARQIFATFVYPERLEELGPSLSKLFSSTEGHVVVRVYPPPADASSQNNQKYEVFVLDGNRQVKSYHGPYSVRGSGGVNRIQTKLRK